MPPGGMPPGPPSGQFGGPPPPPLPPLGLFKSKAGLRAALLNLSGVGAGYFYLRSWVFFGINLAVTLGLLVTAAVMGAADNLLTWAPALLTWVLVTVVHGLFAGRKHDRRLMARGEQPTAGSRPVVLAACLVVVMALSLIGVWQTGEWRLRVADTAHAEGDCDTAIDVYGQVEGGFQLSMSPSLMNRARAGGEACEILRRAQSDVANEAYDHALESYTDYFAHAGSRWEDTDGSIAEIHFDYAAQLAADADQTYTGTVTDEVREAFRQAQETYAFIAEDFSDTPSAAQVPDALVELYDVATGDYQSENWCSAFDQIEMFDDLSWDAAPDIAERIEEERPDAALNCGWAQVDSGDLDDADETVEYLEASYPDYETDDVEKLTKHIGAGRIEQKMDLQTIFGESSIEDMSPYETGGGDKVVIEFTNNSPEEMHFMYVGPDAVHGEEFTDPCEGCEVYSSPPTGNSCFDDGEVMRIELDPGEYRLMITSTESGFGKPLHGTKNLKAGETYKSCYYKMENS
ncbi:tetratricopeptide repeat protein [Nocardiopsis prasina]|uniref:tetratricopeptide repeat protein n=1 Tax=Nocardiopsis prasina TaxID=2015 RepID=UPI00034CEFCE